VAIAFEADDATVAWAKEAGLLLLLPPRAVVDAVADKIKLLDLAAAAGVATPRATVAADARPEDAAHLWRRAGGGPLVAQLRRNNLTGAGTRPVGSQDELRECLAAWRGEEVKLAEFVDGLPLTVSGCVGPDRTLVSGISHQLVGYPRLTAVWGAHCGNQLLDDDDLPPGAARACRQMAAAIGEQLRGGGFRGMFGLDLLADAGRVLAVEINPRIQSVTSLLNVAEVEAGLLPAPGAHVLSYLLDRLPEPRCAPGPVPPLSQLVLYARRGGALLTGPPAGRLRLSDGALLPAAGCQDQLSDLASDEALLWPFAGPGDVVRPGDRLVVVQFTGRAAPVSTERRLHERAMRWLDAVEARVRYAS
jgi:ATP-grasp domain